MVFLPDYPDKDVDKDGLVKLVRRNLAHLIFIIPAGT